MGAATRACHERRERQRALAGARLRGMDHDRAGDRAHSDREKNVTDQKRALRSVDVVRVTARLALLELTLLGASVEREISEAAERDHPGGAEHDAGGGNAAALAVGAARVDPRLGAEAGLDTFVPIAFAEIDALFAGFAVCPHETE